MMCRRLRLRRVGWRYRKPISLVHFEFPNGAWRAGSHHPPYTDGLGWAATTGRGCECDQIYSFTLSYITRMWGEKMMTQLRRLVSQETIYPPLYCLHTRIIIHLDDRFSYVIIASCWFPFTLKLLSDDDAIRNSNMCNNNTRTGFCIALITILLNV